MFISLTSAPNIVPDPSSALPARVVSEEMKAAAAAARHAPPVGEAAGEEAPAKKGPAKARKTAPARAWRA
ncbi:MAG: hypothetical protein U1F49_19895 [Rubrivivax sp.]